ncbi:ferritin-like domain-containing protein [Actinomadura sp. KC06]|uniref:ferritin-like domain-containing protein n=1 Tax=Actinomadura sp. KC06 TaxID=2530369 RepID=UPI001046275E|nr:ferritin-like domain-containing protein [Actinomadura sp. KC06]TDD34959.1 ferritin-like domain-containing protein [Actinomadura sp. KC06]
METPEIIGTDPAGWSLGTGGDTLFTWDYDTSAERLLSLYRKGKQKQWDAELRLDWTHEVDPGDPLGLPDEFVWIADSELWRRLPERERTTVRRHMAGWLYSQFLHGEQGALICSAKVVQTVPDLDAKFYAATQVMDEARHVEIYQRMLNTKIGIRYGLSTGLRDLLETIVRDSRWDITYLGMQVMIEGLALASFSIQRDRVGDPLARALNAYVLQDEARHVAFGRLALRDYYRELSAPELKDREDFALDACWALRDRFAGEEMWRHLDYGADECIRLARRSPAMREFRRRLFTRIVPTLRDINLFGPRMQDGLKRLGVLGFGRLDGAAISEEDERIAEEVARLEMFGRAREVADVIARGADEDEH